MQNFKYKKKPIKPMMWNEWASTNYYKYLIDDIYQQGFSKLIGFKIYDVQTG